jgi:hypothetical protein
VLVVPALIAVVALPVTDRMPPGRAAVVLAWSAVGVAAAEAISLGLLAAEAMAQVPAVGRLFAVVARDTTYVPWVPWVSLALLGYAALAVAHRREGQWRALAAADSFAGLPGDQQVLLVSGTSADAYSIEGPPGRIIVTTGMRESLTDRQYAVLLAHEREHLTGRHHRLMRLAELAGAAHPALRVLAARVDYLIERAADERAADHVGDRKVVAHAIAVAALVAGGRPAGGLHMASRLGVVPRRVAAMLHPPAAPASAALPGAPGRAGRRFRRVDRRGGRRPRRAADGRRLIPRVFRAEAETGRSAGDSQVASFLLAGLAMALVNAPGVNMISLGEEVALGLGVGLARVRWTRLAGTCTCAPMPVLRRRGGSGSRPGREPSGL